MSDVLFGNLVALMMPVKAFFETGCVLLRLIEDGRFRTWFVAVVVLALLLSLPVLQGVLMSGEFHGRWVDEPAGELGLPDVRGRQVLLSDYAGSHVYVYFGYLRCDGYCQAQMVTLFLLGQKLGDLPVGFVFVTLDPARDTAAELTGLVSGMEQANFTALRPESLAQAQQVSMAFGARVSRVGSWQQADYTLDHSGEIFLLGPDGRIKLVYAGPTIRADWMLEDLNQLMQKEGL